MRSWNYVFNRAIPSSIAGCVGLQGLDLSGNTLQGQIPVALSRLQNLEQFLNLSNNHLQGEIPVELGELKLLRSLHLSSNMLYGKIPVELGNLTNLRSLNLSGNELEGPVPPVGILKSFNSSSFGVLHSQHRPRHTITVVVISVIVSAIISLLFCIAFIICYRVRRKNNINSEELSISMPGEPLIQRFTKRDLEMATESFSAGNIIGSSTISTVYRGVLRNGKVVAVKILKMENSKELDQCFKRELYTMARIRHRNLVKVVGYAWDNRLKALVMELMPNGNLDAVLHSVDASEGHSAQLDLSKRLSISVSIAQALVYLHENYDFPIVHCDLKPANILLDEDFEAHVSDFGIARMLGIHLQQEASQGTLSAFQPGTIGYVAPEFAYMARVTPSADVFSFGIILVELLTRKRPTSFPSSSSASDQKCTSLPEWIENVFKDCKCLISVIDPLLLQNVSEEQEETMTSLLKISLLCTKSTPENRPSMNQVLPWLLKIKENRIHDEDIY